MPATDERPDHACLLHHPPGDGRPWVRADDGYRTCSKCLDRLRDTLRDIRRLYGTLNATPGAHTDTSSRPTPGFASRPAANMNVVVMRDPRSLPYEAPLSTDGVQYVWDPLADDTLEPGQYGPPGGAYVEKRDVWYGADGRPHTEQPRAMLSVPATLAGITAGIADLRDITPPRGDVPDLVRWLDNQLDWLTRQDWVPEPAAELHRLAAQLRGVDEPRRRIGRCPNTIDEGEHTRPCQAWLYAPLRGDTIVCHACGRRWERDEWLNLGDLLGDAQAAS